MKTDVLYLFDLPAVCRIAECGRKIQNKREGLCGAHYHRLWRYGDPLAGGPARPDRRPAKVVIDYPDGTRQCNQCGERLPITQFHKDSGNKAGRRSHCVECHSANARKWYAANRERQAQRERERRLADPERYRRWDMERYERDRDKRIALANENAHKRRVRLKAGEYDATVTRSNLRKQYGDGCFYCQREMDFRRYTKRTKPGILATVEHIVPISRGGGHTWENVVLACLDCNLRKNAKSLTDWLASQEAA